MRPRAYRTLITASLVVIGCQTQPLQTSIQPPQINTPIETTLTESFITKPALEPTQIRIPKPTLTYERQKEFFELLRTNGNCNLPCFWGIMPGKTLWEDANSFLEPFSYNAPITVDNFRSTPAITAYDVAISTTMDIDLTMVVNVDVNRDGVVKDIIMRTEIFKDGYLGVDDKHMIWYSLSEIFRRLGVPDQIYFYLGSRGDYSFDVVYEAVKAVIEITGQAKQSVNGNYRVCPNFGDGDIAYLKIAVVGPSDALDVKTLIGYPFWKGTPPFEEVAGLSVNDFYKLLTDEQQPVCFEIK